MKIVFCGYRDWANKIADGLKADGHEVLHLQTKQSLTKEAVDSFKPDLFFMAGWSWIVSREVYENYDIIGLHPSLLPKYRGGSPIQNQIIRGEKDTGISLFKLTEKLDEGPLYAQERVSFDGHLSDVLENISQAGLKAFRGLVDKYPDLEAREQVGEASFFDRRKPEESELTLEMLQELSSKELFDFIRALEDPYPNAFFKTRDGKKLLFKRVELE